MYGGIAPQQCNPAHLAITWYGRGLLAEGGCSGIQDKSVIFNEYSGSLLLLLGRLKLPRMDRNVKLQFIRLRFRPHNLTKVGDHKSGKPSP